MLTDDDKEHTKRLFIRATFSSSVVKTTRKRYMNSPLPFVLCLSKKNRTQKKKKKKKKKKARRSESPKKKQRKRRKKKKKKKKKFIIAIISNSTHGL